MVYPRQIAQDIKKGIKNKQTPQEILCKLILWQYDDIKQSMKLLKKECSVENFLSAYMEISVQELKKLLKALDEYKNINGKQALRACLIHKIG